VIARLGLGPLALIVGGILLLVIVVVVSGYRLAASWGSGVLELAPAEVPKSRELPDSLRSGEAPPPPIPATVLDRAPRN
jgi:hypothetical protein